MVLTLTSMLVLHTQKPFKKWSKKAVLLSVWPLTETVTVLIAIDENGDIVDGDKIMYIIGKYLSEKGQLAQNTIVTTVMSKPWFPQGLGP